MTPRAQWSVAAPDEESAAALARDLRLQKPAARVLWSRGYRDPDAARRFLAPSLDHLHDPFLLRDMDRAVERLHRAIATGEKILLYGDYDVDGTSSIVLLSKILQAAGAQFNYTVPHRLRDGYGMRPEVVDQAAADQVRLIVSVDTGIRAAAVVEHAAGLGIDCIITDHHLPEAQLPPALAVLNPNRADCAYPEKNLCGAGVAFKLIQALMQRLAWPPERVRRTTESLLKMVAIATVADVVPLTGENRAIVKLGLDGLHTVKNVGLRALLAKAGFADGQTPSAGDIGFRVAPRINAAGRMASASDVVEMFLTGDAGLATGIAERLHDLNRDRQQVEAKIVEACLKVEVAPEEAGLVYSGPNWHKGVVGIVASRVVERHHRPSIVLGEDPETGLAQGSGRSISAFHLLDALESMADLFLKFGGHRQAAGVTLPVERIPEFRRRFDAYARERLTAEDMTPRVRADALLDFRELNDEAVEQVLALAPFGCGNPAPHFAVRGLEVCAQPAAMGEAHLRVPARQNGRVFQIKAWRFRERELEVAAGARIDAIVSLDDDSYSAARGYSPWCMTLKDVRPAS
ncbi:MAG TPA: single-stranded-DNA-specific exonuclease RecJ [Solibacterales bacterium]|nr:single-stranded-DNA-specific exonuclease RecJ [Bryobacterales bacterium]